MEKVSFRCGSGKILYLYGKTRYAGRDSKSRDKLEEIEKYAVPDETGILYEDRWYFVEREYQKPSWKTYLAEMEQTDSVQQVRKSLQGYITQRRAAGGMRKDFTVRFIGELVQTVYGYLKDRGIAFEQIFEREEFEHRRREACLSVVGSREFIEYLFAVLEGQKKSETHSDNVVDQLKNILNRIWEKISHGRCWQEKSFFRKIMFPNFYENDGNVVAKLYRRAQN